MWKILAKFCVLISIFFVFNIAYANTNIQVTHGTDAKIGQFPWYASIMMKGAPIEVSYFGSCGGSLIAPEWVLTAGHCAVNYFDPYLPQAVIGATNLSNDDIYEVINVDKIFIHPKYNAKDVSDGNLAYDFALMHLERPSKADYISLIGTKTNLEKPYNQATVMGWGNTGYGMSGKLMYANIPINPPKKCEELYEYDGVQWFNRDIMICAGTTSGDRYNSAKGDSGGALIAKKHNKDYLIGIVSWGDPNDPNFEKSYPASYSRVFIAQGWIFNTINEYK